MYRTLTMVSDRARRLGGGAEDDRSKIASARRPPANFLLQERFVWHAPRRAMPLRHWLLRRELQSRHSCRQQLCDRGHSIAKRFTPPDCDSRLTAGCAGTICRSINCRSSQEEGEMQKQQQRPVRGAKRGHRQCRGGSECVHVRTSELGASLVNFFRI